jgi:signal transduction histidine kinase
VITVPPWGVIVVAGAIGAAILDRFALVTEIASIIMVAVMLVFVLTARRIVKELRYQVHAIITNQDNEDVEEDISDEVEAKEPTPIFKARRSG